MADHLLEFYIAATFHGNGNYVVGTFYCKQSLIVSRRSLVCMFLQHTCNRRL